MCARCCHVRFGRLRHALGIQQRHGLRVLHTVTLIVIKEYCSVAWSEMSALHCCLEALRNAKTQTLVAFKDKSGARVRMCVGTPIDSSAKGQVYKYQTSGFIDLHSLAGCRKTEQCLHPARLQAVALLTGTWENQCTSAKKRHWNMHTKNTPAQRVSLTEPELISRTINEHLQTPDTKRP